MKQMRRQRRRQFQIISGIAHSFVRPFAMRRSARSQATSAAGRERTTISLSVHATPRHAPRINRVKMAGRGVANRSRLLGDDASFFSHTNWLCLFFFAGVRTIMGPLRPRRRAGQNGAAPVMAELSRDGHTHTDTHTVEKVEMRDIGPALVTTMIPRRPKSALVPLAGAAAPPFSSL